MRILVALDSFKGTLSSKEAGAIVGTSFQRVGCETDVFSVADGGEGTLDAVSERAEGDVYEEEVTDLRHEPCRVRFFENEEYVLIESAQTLAVTRYALETRDVPFVSSYGLGQQITRALDSGKRIVVALGGTGTTDGGLGMLQALGVRVYGMNGEIGRVNPLWDVRALDYSGLDARALKTPLTILCDVESPLYGETGAAKMFAKQKGASDEQIEHLERQLHRLGELYPPGVAVTRGSGAAGGIAAALLSLGGTIVSGVDWVCQQTGLFEALEVSDLVVTGEGRFDAQSLQGKTAFRLAERAVRAQKPIIALVGSISYEATSPFTAMFAINRSREAFERALNPDVARQGLADTATAIANLVTHLPVGPVEQSGDE